MTPTTLDNPIDVLLDGGVASLDITEEMHDLAVARYTHISGWLAAASDGLPDEWYLYPQGSFLLGTVVMPEGCALFDLDFVCRRGLKASQISQADLKESVGTRIRRYVVTHQGLPDGPTSCSPGRRNWKIEYPQFHMDVLPAVPDDEHPTTGILITDREIRQWLPSDPKGYASWFAARGALSVTLVEKRAKIDDVPAWGLRNPLQRTAQLFKRHRDVYFANMAELAPPSILLTTIAGRSYAGQRSIIDAARSAVEAIPRIVVCRNGKWMATNPVHDDPRYVTKENFVDKWAQHPERAEAFFTWVKVVGRDLEEVAGGVNLTSRLHTIQKAFGERAAEGAGHRFGRDFNDDLRSARVRVGAAATLGSLGRPVPRTRFAGDHARHP